MLTDLKRDNQRLIEENKRITEENKRLTEEKIVLPFKHRDGAPKEQSLIGSARMARKVIDSNNSRTQRDESGTMNAGEESVRIKRSSLSSIRVNK